MRVLKIFLLVLSVKLSFALQISEAQTVVLPSGEILKELFSASLNGKKITCAGPIKGAYHSGRSVDVGSNKLFIPLSDDLKALTAKMKSSPAKNKKKLKKKVKKFKKRMKSENTLCAKGPGSNPPTNPGLLPTPTPRPVVTTRPGGNFDSQGNVTEAGKAAFGIPSNLSANRDQGKTFYNNNCTGCHLEKTGYSFSFYKSAIRGSPMFFVDTTDQEIAHLTAYLRRFELN